MFIILYREVFYLSDVLVVLLLVGNFEVINGFLEYLEYLAIEYLDPLVYGREEVDFLKELVQVL